MIDRIDITVAHAPNNRVYIDMPESLAKLLFRTSAIALAGLAETDPRAVMVAHISDELATAVATTPEEAEPETATAKKPAKSERPSTPSAG